MLAEALAVDLRNVRSMTPVGDVPVIVLTEFVPDQHWLPFTRAVIKVSPSPLRYQPVILPRECIEQRIKMRFAKVGSEHRRMYHCRKGVEQAVLPFSEHRRISYPDAKRLDKAGWPHFERNAAGDVARITFNREIRNTLIVWCVANCRTRFHFGSDEAVFETWFDATMAKMSV